MERGPTPGPTVTLASEPGPHTDRKWTGTAVRPGKGTGQRKTFAVQVRVELLLGSTFPVTLDTADPMWVGSQARSGRARGGTSCKKVII